MRFGHVTVFVKNLEESLRFYHELVGLPVKRRFSPRPGTEIAFLGNGETEIELIDNHAQGDVFMGQGISLGFEVTSLQETLDFLRQKGIAAGEVSQPNPQVKFFFVSDPNGLKIQFVEYFC
ncbi:MAG: VOC family protein [Synergistaceae bacterium]|jgi:lactoylglutathione lyase|nr:VOC family protein [Synergistaceae bacterium]